MPNARRTAPRTSRKRREAERPGTAKARPALSSGARAVATLPLLAPAAVLPLLAREAQARERRRQLVRVASELIETGGVDAVTLAAVPERAGCARTLVYRYFGSREDLLIGVIDDYFERLAEHLSAAELASAVGAVVAASTRAVRAEAAALDLVALLWDVQFAAGLGGAILRTTPFLSSEMRARLHAARDRHERPFTDALRAAGLSEPEARTALDAMIASFVALALRARAGEIRRETAIDIHSRLTVGLIRGLRSTRGEADLRHRSG